VSIDFAILEEHSIAVITVKGHVSQTEADAMRARTVRLIEDKKILNFVMDISELLSIEQRSPFAAYALGDEFRSIGFPMNAKTAVVMPTEPGAREQAELLHSVEVNRGRGEIRYVDGVDEGLDWLRSFEAQ
jgi:hypothetical protein